MSTDAPPASPGLEPVLRRVLGEALAPGDASFAVDGVAPALVATPRSVEELAAALAAANEAGAAVVPWGGGRHMGLGNIPARYDLALRTAKLDRLIEYEPADLTVTVEAGMTMGRLQALLGEHGQFLPIDAPAEATVGGALAAGLSGPSCHAYGLPRDWLIGCRFALADGSLVKGGGRVVKNVAGYDLPKLAVGSLGTLGVIVEATFKLAPLPAAQETLVARFDSLEAAAQAVFAADERGLALRGVLLQAEPDGPVGVAFWLAGPRAAVDRSTREIAPTGDAPVEQHEGEASEGWWAANSETQPSAPGMALRASLLPANVPALVERTLAAGREVGVVPRCLAYPTIGLVLTVADGGDPAKGAAFIDEARRWAVEAGGSLVVTSAPVAVKERIDVWGAPSTSSGPAAGSALPLMRRLKEQFDPRGTLNPGRFVGGL